MGQCSARETRDPERGARPRREPMDSSRADGLKPSRVTQAEMKLEARRDARGIQAEMSVRNVWGARSATRSETRCGMQDEKRLGAETPRQAETRNSSRDETRSEMQAIEASGAMASD